MMEAECGARRSVAGSVGGVGRRRWRGEFGGVEELGELEVDHAELAGAAVVGDVAQDGILVAYPEGEQGIVDLAHAVGVEMVDPLAAVGGDNLEFLRDELDELRHEVAALRGEVLEDADLVFEAFARQVPAEGLVHAAVEADANECAGGVLDLLHERGRESLRSRAETSPG